MSVKNKFLRPNQDEQYYAQQTQVFQGLWTPYGVVVPLSFGIWPNGSVDISYYMKPGAEFAKSQKRKIKYIEERGIEVSIMHPSPKASDE